MPFHITSLSESLNGAKKSIETGQAQTFLKDLEQVHLSLFSGNPDAALQDSFSLPNGCGKLLALRVFAAEVDDLEEGGNHK